MADTITWSQEMIDYLNENYSTVINDTLAETLGVSIKEIRSQAKKLKLKKSEEGKKGVSWTKEEVEILIEEYPNNTVGELVSILDNKFTTVQINNKINKLKLKKEKKWTEELVQYLVDNHEELTIKEMIDDKLQGFTEVAVYRKMSRLELSIESGNNSYYHWSDEEISTLKKFYPLRTNKELQEEFFPNLSLSQIKSKGGYLNLRKLDIVAYKARVENTNPDIWTEQEKKDLIEYYGKMSNKELQIFYLSNRSISAIKKQASKLGVYNRFKYDFSWYFELEEIEEIDDTSVTIKVTKTINKEEGEAI